MVALWTKNSQIPEPLHIKRPGERPPTVSMGEMARRIAGR